MLTKEEARTEHGQKQAIEFRKPQGWSGKEPQKEIRICFVATNVEAWETGTTAIVTWKGKRFRITCEGKETPVSATTRGILVGE